MNIIDKKDLPEWAQRQASITDHPIVKINGIFRYKQNNLIVWLTMKLKNHTPSYLNDMKIIYDRLKPFTQEEFMQFYRDTGCSLCHFEEIWGDILDELDNA